MAGQAMNKGRGINTLGTKPPFVKGGSTRGKTANGGASKGGGDKTGGVSLDGTSMSGNSPGDGMGSMSDGDAYRPAHSSSHASGQTGSARGRSSNSPKGKSPAY